MELWEWFPCCNIYWDLTLAHDRKAICSQRGCKMTDPFFLCSHDDLVEKVLLDKRPHSIMDDDNLWFDRSWPLLITLTQSQDSITYWPVTSHAACNHSNLPVLKALDDVCHQVYIFFGNNNHNALDPWHPARTNDLLSKVCLVRWEVRQARENRQNITQIGLQIINWLLFACLT